MDPIPYTLYPIPYTLYPIPYALCPMPYSLYLILYTLIAALEFSEASAIPTRLARPSGSGLKTCDTDGGSALKVLPTGSGPFDLFSAEASLFDDDPSETREVASLTGEGYGGTQPAASAGSSSSRSRPLLPTFDLFSSEAAQYDDPPPPGEEVMDLFGPGSDKFDIREEEEDQERRGGRGTRGESEGEGEGEAGDEARGPSGGEVMSVSELVVGRGGFDSIHFEDGDGGEEKEEKGEGGRGAGRRGREEGGGVGVGGGGRSTGPGVLSLSMEGKPIVTDGKVGRNPKP